MKVYSITIGDGRSTEELVAAANYGYCHSQVISDNFPARPFTRPGPSPGQALHPARPFKEKTAREIVLLSFDNPFLSEEATVEAAKQGLERPFYEDGLYFGIDHPEVQLAGPVAFLHDPWLGNHGRRDAICLWNNAGRRELGPEGFDDLWPPNYRLAFVRGARPGAQVNRD